MKVEELYEIYGQMKWDGFETLIEEHFYLTDLFYEYDAMYDFKYHEDAFGAYIESASDVINKSPLEYEEFKQGIKMGYKYLSDEEIFSFITTMIAMYFKRIMDKKEALSRGDEWRSDPSKVQYYGSKNQAENRGYDSYMLEHNSDEFNLFSRVYNERIDKNNNLGSR